MKTIIITFLFNCFFILAYSQDTLNKLPEGWKLAGNSKEYIAGTEKDSLLNKKVAFLKSTAEVYKEMDFGTIAQSFNATKYLGKRVKFSALVKTSNIEEWAGLWLRTDDDDGRTISFDNMADRQIKGTNNWKKYESVTDIPLYTDKILFGFLISGKGTGWIDEIKFEVVDSSIALTGKTYKQTPVLPQNLSFEIPSQENHEVSYRWNFYNKNKSHNISIVKDSIKNGNVLLIESSQIKETSLGFITQTIKSRNYRNTKIKITAYVKSENVENEAHLILYCLKSNNRNTLSKKIKGTNDWKKYEIIADVPSTSKPITFGVFLNGNGKLWVDDFTFEVIEGTDKSKIPDEPINLTF
ncbi:MAG: hypothetical protein HY951_14660 [Bacteroidia bacterium]|nr:hypothetical protein [Bacteroidia bacterium]